MKDTAKDSNQQFSFPDLTLREIFALFRYHFTAMFACLLVFGLPWAIFSGFDLGLRATLSEDTYSWWSKAFAYAILALFAYLVLKNVPHFFHYFGDMFAQLGHFASKLRLPSQILLLLFVVGYFWAWYKYPTLVLVFSVVVMIPAGLTYDRYIEVLKDKSNQKQNIDP